MSEPMDPEGQILARIPLRKNLSVRLSTLLAASGFFTRKQLKRAFAYVDGKKVQSSTDLTFAKGERVHIECFGEEFLAYADPELFLAMHKPVGVITGNTNDLLDNGELSVFDLLPSWLLAEDLQPIGRLDKESSGLLLFTENGALNQRMRHPSRKVARIYEATLARPIPDDLIAHALDNGITLKNGESVHPAAIRALDGDAGLRYEITLTEGKYHEVRRFFAALGSHVEALHRVGYHHFRLSGTTPRAPGEVDEALAVMAEASAEQKPWFVSEGLVRISGALFQDLLNEFHVEESPIMLQLEHLASSEGDSDEDFF